MALQQPSAIIWRFDGLARNIHRNCAAVFRAIHSAHCPLINGVCPPALACPPLKPSFPNSSDPTKKISSSRPANPSVVVRLCSYAASSTYFDSAFFFFFLAIDIMT